MSRILEFTDGEELTLLLPIEAPGGERLELERWPFNDVAAELERCAEEAARGERRAQKVYQRIVYVLRSERARRAKPP